MFKKNNIVVVIMTALFAACGGPSDATLVSLPDATLGRLPDATPESLPKALKSPFDSMALAVPLWGPMAYDFNCITHLDECQGQPKKASLLSLPKVLKPQLDRLSLDTRALPPMAHSVFCFQYPNDCTIRKIAFRGGRFALTPKRWRDLEEVNAKVNRSIKPERNLLGLAGEKWIIAPKSGDCNDYAVTKQHELLARGWPSRTLLLAEVKTSWGEGHLILVVRAGDGDFVLDNMNPTIRPWSKVPYQWVRVQSPRNPRAWSTVRSINA